MKKTLALLLAAVMLLSVLAACSSKAETPAEPEQTTEEPAQTPDAPAEETTEETTAAEEPSQEELDQAAADEVAAMIDAIYVQTRTNETDAQCEAAKAAWDALTDAQKALVEGDEASPDYFGLDTGDASKDDPRNQDDIGENELLVVSFGTSFNDSRVADIKGIEDALQEANPDWSVRRAFTAQIIINHIQARDGEKIDNMTQALDRAVANGVKNLVVQPTHLMHGAEYDEMCEALEQYKDKFESVAIAEPMLPSSTPTRKLLPRRSLLPLLQTPALKALTLLRKPAPLSSSWATAPRMLQRSPTARCRPRCSSSVMRTSSSAPSRANPKRPPARQLSKLSRQQATPTSCCAR